MVGSYLETARPRSAEEMTSFLDPWKLGEGTFASVYEDPYDSGLAIKVQLHEDPCFERFVERAGRIDNPHLPRVLDQMVLDDGTLVYSVERLENIPPGGRSAAMAGLDLPAQVAIYTIFYWNLLRPGDPHAVEDIRRAEPPYEMHDVKAWLLERFEREGVESRHVRDDLERYLKSCPDPMCEAVSLLIDFWRSEAGCMTDLVGHDNIMRSSSGEIVFSDPFADPEYFPASRYAYKFEHVDIEEDFANFEELAEFLRTLDGHDVASLLNDYHLGAGYFASVYRNPWDDGQAIKVVREGDPCFEEYVLELGNQSPHFPTVHDRFILSDDDTMVYVLERYEPLEGELLSYLVAMDFPQKVAMYYLYAGHFHGEPGKVPDLGNLRGIYTGFDEVYEWLDREMRETGDSMAWVLTDYLGTCGDSLCSAVLELVDYLDRADSETGCGRDLHSGNVMKGTDGRIVFTDPVS